MSRHIRTGVKSGPRQEWRTARGLARALVDDHCVDLDVCAVASNAVVPRYIGPPDYEPPARADRRDTSGMVASDALVTRWGDHGTIAFCNPPFSLALAFVNAAIRSIWPADPERRALNAAVFLLPANPDTRWFAALVDRGARFGLFRGRVAFEAASVEIEAKSGAAFPCMLAVLGGWQTPRQPREPSVFEVLDPATGRTL